jgi:S1-C subfamily serine protease
VLRFTDPEFSANLHSLELSSLPLLREQSVFTIAAPPNYVSHYVSPGEMALLNTEAELFTQRRGYIVHYSRLIDGCTGSPIINEFGDVVGLNTRFLIKGQQPAVVALDSYTLRDQFKKILQHNGEIPRSFLGVEFKQDLSERHSDAYPMIAGVVDGGPSETGLSDKINHYITHINGSSVNSLQQLWAILESVSPDSDVSLRLLKDVRGFGVDTVVIKAAKLDTENFCKIGSYFLEAQKPGKDGREYLSKDEYVETSALEKLGKTVKLSAWERVVTRLDFAHINRNGLNISSENQMDSTNSLYY